MLLSLLRSQLRRGNMREKLLPERIHKVTMQSWPHISTFDIYIYTYVFLFIHLLLLDLLNFYLDRYTLCPEDATTYYNHRFHALNHKNHQEPIRLQLNGPLLQACQEQEGCAWPGADKAFLA